MKKKLLLIIAILMVLSTTLFACGGDVKIPKFSIEIKDSTGAVIATVNEETVKNLTRYKKTMITTKNDERTTYVFAGYALKDVLAAANVNTTFDVYELNAAKSANPKPLTTAEKDNWFIALWTEDANGVEIELVDDGPVRAFNSTHTSTGKWCKNLDTITLKNI